MELVDYTAELEVTVDTLQRQLASVSEELEERSREVATLRAGRTAALQERDLAVDAKPDVASVAAPPVVADCPVVRCPEVKTVACPEAQIIERFRACPQLDCPSSMERCEGEVSAALEEQRAALNTSRLALNDSHIRVRQLENELAQVRRAAESSQKRDDARARFVTVRSAAVRGLQQRVISDAQSLSELLRQRDQMASQLKTAGNSGGLVGFKLQPATASSGRTISDIERELATAVEARQVVALRSQLQEIRGKIQQDIAFMKRVAR